MLRSPNNKYVTGGKDNVTFIMGKDKHQNNEDKQCGGGLCSSMLSWNTLCKMGVFGCYSNQLGGISKIQERESDLPFFCLNRNKTSPMKRSPREIKEA